MTWTCPGNMGLRVVVQADGVQSGRYCAGEHDMAMENSLVNDFSLQWQVSLLYHKREELVTAKK